MEQRTIRPRIADVAREAGVSKTAVSFAFNSPDRLSPETAQRIREVADQLGYTPHPVARMLSQRETLTIGVLTPQALSVIFSNPFFGAFSEGVAVAAEESGYALYFISPLHGSLARAMSRATVDGVVAIGLSDDHPEVEQIRRAGRADRAGRLDRPPRARLGRDRRRRRRPGRRRAPDRARPSRRPGHRRRTAVAVASRSTRTASPARRLRGYREAFAAVGVDIPDEHVRGRAGQHRRRHRGLHRRLGGRPPSDGRAGHERRHGDRRDACGRATCA